MDKKALSERDIYTQFITPALVAAGWDLQRQVHEEVRFTKGRVIGLGMSFAHSCPAAKTMMPETVNQDVKALVPPAEFVPYVLLALQALKPQIVAAVDRSSHGTCKLVSEKLWSTELEPVPLAEQHRILAKASVPVAHCDQLNARIAAARAEHTQPAKAPVGSAEA